MFSVIHASDESLEWIHVHSKAWDVERTASGAADEGVAKRDGELLLLRRREITEAHDRNGDRLRSVRSLVFALFLSSFPIAVHAAQWASCQFWVSVTRFANVVFAREA
jgi:hypothetical protein